jgi:hypothetical protein
MHLLPPVTYYKDKVALQLNITPELTQSSNILDIQTGKKKMFSFLPLLLYLGEVPIRQKAVELI